MNVHESRKDYNRLSLSEGELDPDPIRQFHHWFEEAALSEIAEPNAMAWRPRLPTAVLRRGLSCLRGYDGGALPSSRTTRAARAASSRPTHTQPWSFHWHDLERQVRIEGPVARTSAEESDRYFQGRPAGSRLGAWASRQSEVIADREILGAACRALELQYADGGFPGPSTGADTASSPRSSSSGKADPAGCTTGCGTPEANAVGSSSGYRRDASDWQEPRSWVNLGQSKQA